MGILLKESRLVKGCWFQSKDPGISRSILFAHRGIPSSMDLILIVNTVVFPRNRNSLTKREGPLRFLKKISCGAILSRSLSTRQATTN